jgi:hypothetical protein
MTTSLNENETFTGEARTDQPRPRLLDGEAGEVKRRRVIIRCAPHSMEGRL